MSVPFLINFRREAFRRERADVRRRAVGLGVWLTYFGVLAVLLGLYGLNARELVWRTRQLQRQIERQRATNQGGAYWVPSADEAAAVEPWVADAARWRDLLAHLPALVPADIRLSSIQFNPENVSGGEHELLLSGVMRMDSARENLSGVTSFVNVLSRDSLFAARFRNVRLLSSRTSQGGKDTEFQVECR